MNLSTRNQQLQRSLYLGNRPFASRPTSTGLSHPDRVRWQLQVLGMSRWGLATHEAKYLPEVIHPDEDIGGVVYGFSENGYAMLVVTDRRALLIDRKPLFTNEDDISFDVISGVELSSVGYLSTVVLHTRIKDYTIKTYNKKCARGFINYIESRCIEYQSRGQWRG